MAKHYKAESEIVERTYGPANQRQEEVSSDRIRAGFK